jgi:hypothetical protein
MYNKNEITLLTQLMAVKCVRQTHQESQAKSARAHSMQPNYIEFIEKKYNNLLTPLCIVYTPRGVRDKGT